MLKRVKLKKVKYKIVKKHPFCRGQFKQYQKNGTFSGKAINLFRSEWGLQNTTTEWCVIATCNRRVVGFFRFSTYDDTLYACGTYVTPKFRGSNIALKMWGKALKHDKNVKVVDVPISSAGGQGLIRKLKKKHKKVVFGFWYTDDFRSGKVYTY